MVGRVCVVGVGSLRIEIMEKKTIDRYDGLILNNIIEKILRIMRLVHAIYYYKK